MDNFFSAVQDVANNPSTTPERQVLLGEAAAPMLLAGLALAVLFFAAARAFWLFALRFYTSASS